MPDETTTAVQDVKTSDGNKGNTSGNARTYTEEELRKQVSDALAEAGRKHKLELQPILQERDSYKTQVREINRSLDTISGEREDLKLQLSELTKGDPEKFNLVEKDRTLKNQERKLKADAAELEAKQADLQERFKKVEIAERNENIRDVAKDYNGVSEDKLKTLCEKLNITNIEAIKAAAETIGTRKQEKPPETNQPHKPDSTVTNGGDNDFKTIRDAYNKNPDDPKAKAEYLAARRKKGI